MGDDNPYNCNFIASLYKQSQLHFSFFFYICYIPSPERRQNKDICQKCQPLHIRATGEPGVLLGYQMMSIKQISHLNPPNPPPPIVWYLSADTHTYIRLGQEWCTWQSCNPITQQKPSEWSCNDRTGHQSYTSSSPPCCQMVSSKHQPPDEEVSLGVDVFRDQVQMGWGGGMSDLMSPGNQKDLS